MKVVMTAVLHALACKYVENDIAYYCNNGMLCRLASTCTHMQKGKKVDVLMFNKISQACPRVLCWLHSKASESGLPRRLLTQELLVCKWLLPSLESKYDHRLETAASSLFRQSGTSVVIYGEMSFSGMLAFLKNICYTIQAFPTG